MTLLAHFDAHLLDDADNIAFLRGRVRSDDEIRSAQDVNMQRVVLHHECVIDQFANETGGRRRFDLIERVQRLGRSDMMCCRANTTYPARDLRHILGRPANAEYFEAAQFGDLHVGVFHVSGVVEENINLPVAFEAGNGINRHPATFGVSCGDGALGAFIPNLLSFRIHKK